MAFTANELFREEFTSQSLVVVEHSLNREHLDVKLIIDGLSRPDLMSNVIVDRDDPTNKFAVSLTSSQSGVIQVLEKDIYSLGALSASQLVTLGFSDSFVFGEEYDYAESLSEDSTTSTSLQTKLTLTTASVPAGKYLVKFSYVWRNSTIAYDIIVEVAVDGTSVFDQHEEARDLGSDQAYCEFGMAQVDLTAASHDITIKWATENATNTSYIKYARLAIWRVR